MVRRPSLLPSLENLLAPDDEANLPASVGAGTSLIKPWRDVPITEKKAKRYHNKAVEFGLKYRIGCPPIAEQEMNDWLVVNMPISPPTNMEKGSEGWQAFLTRRHWAIWKINEGAKHPRMKNTTGVKPFRIKSLRGRFEVVDMTDAIVRSDTPNTILKLAEKRYNDIAMFRRSLPASEINDQREIILNMAMDAYEGFARSVINEAQRVVNLLGNVEKLLNIGERR